MAGGETTLAVEGLKTHFFTKAGVVKAVDGVSFEVGKGEIMGLVGESGSGKTVTGFSIIGLVDPPGRVVEGRIIHDGRDLVGLDDEQMRSLRGNRIAMIFQDPMMTLNPVLRIETQMVEAVLAHNAVPAEQARDAARDALGQVGIPSPDERLRAYPHQFSGGMRQRVAIAIALLNRPSLDHCRRADHGARRDHPGTDPVRGAKTVPGDRCVDDLDHARSRRGRRHRRPDLGDVCRAHCRAGNHRRHHRPAGASLYPRPDRLGSEPQHPWRPAVPRSRA